MVVKHGTKINAIHGCQEDVNRDCPTVICYLIRVVVDYKDLRWRTVTPLLISIMLQVLRGYTDSGMSHSERG